MRSGKPMPDTQMDVGTIDSEFDLLVEIYDVDLINIVYRACIRAENSQTNQHSSSFCVTYKTGEKSKDKNDQNRICIQREANWFEPLEHV